MKKNLAWGNTSYKIILDGEVIFERINAACFSEFNSSKCSTRYDTVRLLDIACEQTQPYHDFFLKHVIDMFQLEATFGEDYFEFKSLGLKRKDMAVMSVLRLLWENAGNIVGIDTPELFFKPLMTQESPYEDKLQTFCHFYSLIRWKSGYFSEGHSWKPQRTIIRTTKEFVEQKEWTSVNSFFSKDI